ncbi:hypothetical protein FDP41_005878 [Naegleria fowleri]|uniref:Uncharacterized protein n=1 Tax=Naegleria fowleri TaxID=5763 RepID=A0A6A5BNG6_NAEFO|nr:uncharacterized protein FDP41_005878 [Naegleria fowleri]KAF0975125.1 hypothetical protein FDP41_005878 [Naegleria fowleri]CAG4718322.1 unnamed protein product [Naegleria fowleri]
MSSSSFIPDFIIDFGSFTTKYGLPSDEIPFEFHTIVGQYEMQGFSGMSKISCGTKVLQEKSIGNFRLKTLSPMVSRGVFNGESTLNMETLCHQAFRSLYTLQDAKYSEQSLREKKLNVTLAAVQSQHHVRNLTQLIFEKFGISSLQFFTPTENIERVLIDNSKTASHTCGEHYILEMGHGITQLAKLKSNSPVCHIPLGGMDITKYIKEHLTNGAEESILKLTELKEQNCHCSPVPSSNLHSPENVFSQAPEVLFSSNPQQQDTLVSTIHKYISSHQEEFTHEDPNVHMTTIHLSGGSSLLKGLKERLEFELNQNFDKASFKGWIKVKHNKMGKDSSFFGACKRVKENDPSSRDQACSLSEYKEKGMERVMAENYKHLFAK